MLTIVLEKPLCVSVLFWRRGRKAVLIRKGPTTLVW
jgi:hypothetical protein